jgi:hypothetical protein
VFVKLLHIVDGQPRVPLGVCLHWARAFREWYQRPSTRKARGLKLLREWLTPEQLAQYDTHGYFDVTGCHSGKRYQIRHGTAANVDELDYAGHATNGWCFVPGDNLVALVAGDVMLAQKIALETDERAALAVAKSFLPSDSWGER